MVCEVSLPTITMAGSLVDIYQVNLPQEYNSEAHNEEQIQYRTLDC